MPHFIRLEFHCYKYFPYEYQLAERELIAIGAISTVRQKSGMEAQFASTPDRGRLKSLTYFKKFEHRDQPEFSDHTWQHLLETSYHNEVGPKRQQTRYSTHGWHEYKGRFNPQIVHGILNCFFDEKKTILDPFCGSGTTLVECAHRGIDALGVDINPFSSFLANSKLKALKTPTSLLWKSLPIILKAKPRSSSACRGQELAYLKQWFSEEILRQIEGLRHAILTGIPENQQSIFLSLISDLLRDYSQQEPTDLRIRRRFSPMPDIALNEAIELKIRKCLTSIEKTRDVIGVPKGNQRAQHGTAESKHSFGKQKFDGVVTSPPYATALPYIDTQRLTLVWLQLIKPEEIAMTEESLIGAREADKSSLRELLRLSQDPSSLLPASVSSTIKAISEAHSEGDGFRKRAVPALLFRYFSRMREALRAMHESVKNDGRAVLVVGTNRTSAGGKGFEIATPVMLAEIAETVGWEIQELFPLQTYHRYGLNSKNAVLGESLVVLHKK